MATWPGATTITDLTGQVFVCSSGAANKSEVIASELLQGLATQLGTTLVIPRTLDVQQNGGTAGRDCVRISHDGTDAVIENRDRSINIKAGVAFTVFPCDVTITARDKVYTFSDGTGSGFYCRATILSTDSVRLSSSGQFNWSSSAAPEGTRDTALVRAAAKVVGVSDGSSAGGTLRSVPLTPAQITADQNNYAPGTAFLYRLSSDAARTITGLSCSQVDGQLAEFRNVGTFPITLAHDVTSTAANRFYCPGSRNCVIGVNQSAFLRYDSTVSRWQVWSNNVVEDTLVVRQPGGVAGTDDLLLYDDGSNGIVESLNGELRLKKGTNLGMRVQGFATLLTNVFIDAFPLSGVSNTVLGLGSGTLRSTPVTPAQITSDQNNYAPGVARFYRLSTDASRNVTGLSCSQVDGQECEVWNVGSNNLVLKHQDAASTAANRFICTAAADITLAADEIALLRYDSTAARWRVRKV